MLTIVGNQARGRYMLTIVSASGFDLVFSAHDLGMAIKRARRARDLTQVQLAEHANVSRGALQKLEQGRGTVTLPTILRLLRTLSLDLAVVSRRAPAVNGRRRDKS